MALSRQEEMLERKLTIENDRKVREQQDRVFAPDQSLPRQATTMHAFALADAATPRGRYTAQERSTVVGANPVIDYPAGPAWCADPGSQLLEPPLGIDNPALEPSTVFSSCSPVEQPDGPLARSAQVDLRATHGSSNNAPTPIQILLNYTYVLYK